MKIVEQFRGQEHLRNVHSGKYHPHELALVFPKLGQTESMQVSGVFPWKIMHLSYYFVRILPTDTG